MTGIKRKTSADIPITNSVKKAKKPKTDLAVKPVAAQKSGKPLALGRPKDKRQDERTQSSKLRRQKKEIDPVPADDLDQSDTTEEENGFYGFSASEGADMQDEDDDGGVLLSPGREAGSGAVTGVLQEGKSSKAVVNGSSELQKTGTTSREAHAKQKALTKERKAARPNADEIARAKKIWERLRIKTNVPKEERNQLVAELFEIITGRVKDFVFKHDSVRTVQCALKYATMPQRESIAGELKGEYRGLVESRYSKFLVAKLITEGNEAIRSMIIEEFYGHVRKLINHPEASWILDDVYRQVASSAQKNKLLREWYGPEFTIFKSSNEKTANTAELSAILKDTPDKKKPIMDYLHQMINQCIQKKLTGFTILHDAMLQYYLNVAPDSSEAGDFRTLIIGDKEEEEIDLLKNLAFTKSGSQLVCLALAHGSAKERKQILRAYKDTVEMLAYDKHGYLVLLTAFDVLDDTRETVSRIFNELILLAKGSSEEAQHEKVLALMDHLSGHTVLLYPFAGAAKWLIPLETQQHMRNIHKIRETTSKKNPATRQSELTAALSPVLLSTVATHAQQLSTSPWGSTLIREVLLNGFGDVTSAVSAVAATAEGDPTEEQHIANSPTGSRMLKSLVAGGPYDPVAKKVIPIEPPLNFHNHLYEVIRPHILTWATGMGSLVVVALMEAEGFESKDELRKELKKQKKALQKAASEETVVQKAARERGEQKGTDAQDAVVPGAKGQQRKGGKAAKAMKERKVEIGNRGAQLLLEMLM